MNKVSQGRAGDLAVTLGTRWRIDGATMTVVAITGSHRVIVEDAQGTRRSVRAGELRPLDIDDAAPGRRIDPSAIATEDWERARQVQVDLEPVVGQSEVPRTAIGALAAKWGVSRATAWRRIQRYRSEHSLAALIDRRPGPQRGAAYALATQGAEARVPAIWGLEIANVITKSEARGVLTTERSQTFLAAIAAAPILCDAETHSMAMTDILALARRHRLSSYDASYLELALRSALALATLNHELQRAADNAGVKLVKPS